MLFVHVHFFQALKNKSVKPTCIIVATDLLRLRRMYDINVNQIIGFAFPKLPEPSNDSSNQQCVVKVVVSWLDLRFKYSVEKLSRDQVADHAATLCSGQVFTSSSC